MAAVAAETAFSRKRSGRSNERQYKISGATDEMDALACLYAAAPASLGFLALDADETGVEEFEAGDGIYLGTAKYQNPSGGNQAVGSFSYTFNISAQTTNLKHSYSTRHKYTASGETARDFKGAINVDNDGNVNGVEISTPVVQLEYGCTFAPSAVTQAFVNGLGSLVGTVNSADYLGNSTGEMLLTSVSGQLRDETHFDIKYGFGVIKNRTGITIDTITGIEQYGWEYRWVYYVDTLVTLGDGTKLVQSKATNVFIEQIYQMSDFSGLGIPTLP